MKLLSILNLYLNFIFNWQIKSDFLKGRGENYLSMFDGNCSTCSEPSDSDWCLSCKKKFNRNNKELFRQEYLMKWSENLSPYNFAYELWIDYEYQCEKYDRVVCHGELDRQGFTKPASGYESRLINLHASNLASIVISKAKELKISNKDLQDARRNVNRLTWKGIQEEYQRLSNMEEQ